MRTLLRVLSIGLIATIPAAGQAQPSFGNLFGLAPSDPDDAAPGAYASPSAIPDAAIGDRLGIPQTQGRLRFNPIELPDGASDPVSPDLALPALPAFAPQTLPGTSVLRPPGGLLLSARLSPDGAPITSGLVWRLFSTETNREGRLQLVGVSKGGDASFDVEPGPYLLHVGYGRAGVTKRIEFTGSPVSETIVLEAGGLRLSASASTDSAEPIDSSELTFDVFAEDPDGVARQLVASRAPADVVLRLNAGAYQVVSNYGAINAIARAEVRVEPDRVTNARLQHRAASMTMKLVREAGGEAIADTAWFISSSQGDVIGESVGAFSSMVLAEGDYVIVAKNRDRIYERELTVQAGEDAEVEVVVTETAEAGSPEGGSGD